MQRPCRVEYYERHRALIRAHKKLDERNAGSRKQSEELTESML